MPARPSWLRRLPDAIAQLEQVPQGDVTCAELQTLLGVSERRARVLMGEWGATRRGGRGDLLLEKGALLRRFRALQRGRRVEEEQLRVERVIGILQEARISRVKVKVDPAMFGLKLAALPAGVIVERGRIVVEFATATDAVAKLSAIAQALGNDWDRFEALVEGRRPQRGS
jgi:hypothetical protein